MLTKHEKVAIIIFVEFGDVAQLARAHGSYPWCRQFESARRYLKTSENISEVFSFVERDVIIVSNKIF